MPARERRLGALLLIGGCLPFAGAAVLEGGLSVTCPFRAATGLPCPLCGATRAFSLAVHGDGDLVRYNAVWVVLAGLLVLAGLVALAASAAGRAPITRVWERLPVPASIAVVFLVAWAYALAQRGAIVG